MRWKINFYTEDSGNQPVKKWLTDLARKRMKEVKNG